MTAQVPVMIADFVALVVDHPRRSPRWWKRMLADLVREQLRRRALLDAPAPWTEIQRIRKAA